MRWFRRPQVLKLPVIPPDVGGLCCIEPVSHLLQQGFPKFSCVNAASQDGVLGPSFPFQLLLSKRLYVFCSYKVIAVQILGDVQCRIESVAVLVLQSSQESPREVRHSLTLLFQQKTQIIPIPDQVLQIRILFKAYGDPRKRAARLQQLTFLDGPYLQLS